MSVLVIIHLIQRQHDYVSLPQAKTPAEIISTTEKYSKSNKLSYEIYYKPGCIDCVKMENAGLVKSLHKTKGNVVAINVEKFKQANKRQASTWYNENYVTNTPTLIVRSHGYPIYLYSGDNIKIYNALLAGKNPQTNEDLTHSKNPKAQYYQNDFTNAKSIFVPYKSTAK